MLLGVSYAIANSDGDGDGGGNSAAGIADDTVLQREVGTLMWLSGKVGWCPEDLDFTAPDNDPPITKKTHSAIVRYEVGFTQVW